MIINLAFDILIVAVFLLGALIGIKKGFIVTVAKPVKLVAAIFIALYGSSAVSTALIEPVVGPAVTNKLTEILLAEYAHITAETAEQLPALVKLAASLCGIDIENIASTAEGMSVIQAITDAVTSPVVELFSRMVAFVLIYIVAKLALGIVVSVINLIVNNGIIGVLNKALGCVFTVFLAFIVVWGITTCAEFVLNIPVIAAMPWAEGFTGGPVYQFFKSFTPLDLLLSF